jgi:glutamine synthetase
MSGSPETRLKEDGIQTLEAAFGDLHGALRGKRFPVAQAHHLDAHGFATCRAVLGWDIQCGIFPIEVASFENGYPDLIARPIWETLRRVPWRPGSALVLSDVFETDGVTPLEESPRWALKSVLARARKLGFEAKVGVEMEFYLLGADRKPPYGGVQAYSLSWGSQIEPVIADIREKLGAFGIEVEASHTEYGPAQLEVNLAYGEALESADRALLFKYAVKEIARQHGLIATFMAKPWAEESGSGLHVHQSLWAANGGGNLFAKDRPLAERYLAGQLATVREFSAFGSPSVNSYKRIQDASFAPVNATWGHDNRTVAIRSLLAEPGSASRLELRTASADANPYLVIAGAIAGGLHGVERRLELKEPPQEKNAYGAQAPRLPETLQDALALLEGSAVGRDYFTPRFLSNVLAVGRHEWQVFIKTVTDWERARYLETP